MTVSIKSMDVLDNTPGRETLSGTVRVLSLDQWNEEIMVCLVDLFRPHKSKKEQRKAYACQPYFKPLPEVTRWLDDGECYILRQPPDVQVVMKDEDLLATCKSEKERVALKTHFQSRDARYEAIKPLVCVADSSAPQSIGEVLNNPSYPERVIARAKEVGRDASTIRNWVNRYWRGGCQRSALMPGYAGRCGCPGKTKTQNVKLGRSRLLFKEGESPHRGYKLEDLDKRKLADGYLLISKEIRPRRAYLLTCATHWATHYVTETGKTRAILFEKHRRPTFSQFLRWGCKENGITVTQILDGPVRSAQKVATKGGAETDSLVAVGQQAMFDGTSSDVYLVSVLDRLKKIKPMTRLVLKESRTRVIYGIYCGWEAPSSKTAQQAILHGAMLSKVEWAKRFGVEMPEGAMPGLLARTHHADNGELKSEKGTEAEAQFGFGLTVAMKRRGDRKGGIESEHDKTHAHFDHRIPGTTHGKKGERGEQHAALSSVLNYYEYMSKLIEYIIWHNTVEEVPDLAPDDMLFANPPIKPTRVNIFNWLTRQGLNVSLNVSYEDLRNYTLPNVPAVICHNGIRLRAVVHGRMRKLLRLRYTSAELASTGLLAQVKATGKTLDVRLMMDRNDLSQAWLAVRGRMIRVMNSTRDTTINTKLTLDEWTQYCGEQEILNAKNLDSREQAEADIAFSLDQDIEAATWEVKKAIAGMKKKPSKRSLLSNLDKNRKEEMEFLKRQEDVLVKREREDAMSCAQREDLDAEVEVEDASDFAMQAYHASQENS